MDRYNVLHQLVENYRSLPYFQEPFNTTSPRELALFLPRSIRPKVSQGLENLVHEVRPLTVLFIGFSNFFSKLNGLSPPEFDQGCERGKFRMLHQVFDTIHNCVSEQNGQML